MNMTKEMNQAIKTLTSIGLVNTTSERQRKNCTLEFADLQDIRSGYPVKYTLHKNGYYRKLVFSSYPWANRYDNYQLNKVMKRWFKTSYGANYSIERILIPGQYEVMAARIVPIVINSRKCNKK